jgi:metal-sulfur cluster biosynthetic enzyme
MSAPPSLPDPATLRDALRCVIDPEIGMNIVDLGLVYRLEFKCSADDTSLEVDMTMTSPACPMGDMIIEQVESVLRSQLPETTGIDIRLVWNPPWGPEHMSEHARQHFGW